MFESEGDELTSDALTDRVRVLQRRRGHRFSYDDVVTAWQAAHAVPQARSVLDLGCGIGSVLLMLVDRLGEARGLGIEAQAESFALAQRNVALNGLAGRVQLRHGDLRDPAWQRELREVSGGFDLVTGTPPYKPPGSATPSPDAQRAHARIELRGGVEDYLAAAAALLAPAGTCVVCMEAAGEGRVAAGARAAGLRIERRLRVIPRVGQPALFSVFCLRHGEPALEAIDDGQLVLRDASGLRTDAARALRSFFGLEQVGADLASAVRRTRAAAVRGA